MKKYYSPMLSRDLITPLYHAAKAEGVPMTELASRWVAEGLTRMQSVQEEAVIYVSSKTTVKKQRR